VFNLFDSFSAGLSLLFIVFLELIVVAWIYGEWRVLLFEGLVIDIKATMLSVFSPTRYLDV